MPRTQNHKSFTTQAARGLSGQNLAAAVAAAGQDITSILCGHALAEAVNFLAFAFFGLVCAFHGKTLLIHARIIIRADASPPTQKAIPCPCTGKERYRVIIQIWGLGVKADVVQFSMAF